ncbi:MAG: transcriptional repressor [Chloroflexi bacterium]|nr:transcriptional repressor [Chloroflexota bacterium]
MTDRERELLNRIKTRGGRVTPQRRAIIKALLESDHPSSEQVYNVVHREFPDISFVTVYRTLAALRDMGEVLAVESGTPETHYDGRQPRQHPHLVCQRCGRVADSPAIDLDALLDSAGGSSWELSGMVNIYGICPACREGCEEDALQRSPGAV